jgi:dipeptidase
MEAFQHLTVQVEDEDIRHDIESRDMEKAFPDLPKAKEWNKHEEFAKKRSIYMKEQDLKAYNTLKSQYNIDFLPPSSSSKQISKPTFHATSHKTS